MEIDFCVLSGSLPDFMTAPIEGQPSKPIKLLDEMRAVLRVHRYAFRTEKSYCEWVRRFVKFHGMKSRADLADGARKVEDFLTHLAVVEKVAASTQNQAFNALLFLYERVLERFIPNPKLREQLAEVCRYRHMSHRSENAYWHWIKGFIQFHRGKFQVSSGQDSRGGLDLLGLVAGVFGVVQRFSARR